MTLEELRTNSFLDNYILYMKHQESPRDFHLWVALTIIGASTERKVFMNRAYYVLYPHLYGGLVADSAWCRKSTAMDLGVRLIKKVLPAYPTLEGKITPEQLILELSAEGKVLNEGEEAIHPLLIQADEMSVFFSKMMIQSGIVNLLTSLYMKDRVEYRTKTGGIFTIVNPFISIISGTIPSFLQECVGHSFDDGFIGRFGFVHREEPEQRIARPEMVVDFEEQDLIWRVLEEQLKFISQLEGNVTFDEEAGRFFDEWYEELPGKTYLSESKATGYKGRMGDHVLKFAILLLLSDLSAFNVKEHDLIIRMKHTQRAIKIAESAEKSLTTIFRDMKKDIFTIQEEIEKRIFMGKKIMRTILFAKFRRKLTPTEFDSIIWSLKKSSMISEEVVGKTTYYIYNENFKEEIEKPKKGDYLL
jgi:hypothetical protein